jgi:heme-degrading monooxygenase HmoA
VVVVVFRSRLRAEAGADYVPLARRMAELAASQPGFVSLKTYEAADGERVSLVEFESDDHARAWRDHPEHREAQRRGRSELYDWYRLQVCEPIRDYAFQRCVDGDS